MTLILDNLIPVMIGSTALIALIVILGKGIMFVIKDVMYTRKRSKEPTVSELLEQGDLDETESI